MRQIEKIWDHVAINLLGIELNNHNLTKCWFWLPNVYTFQPNRRFVGISDPYLVFRDEIETHLRDEAEKKIKIVILYSFLFLVDLDDFNDLDDFVII